MSGVLLEIGWRNGMLEAAHDPCAASRGREVRGLLMSMGWPVVSLHSPAARQAGPELSDELPGAAFMPGFEPAHGALLSGGDRDPLDDARITEMLHGEGAPQGPPRGGPGGLILTGLLTSSGVRQTAEAALRRGHAVTIISDACADRSEQRHERALAELRAAGASACTAHELSALLRTGQQARRIGITEMAELTGLSRDTLRWYEREGLIPRVGRSSSGYREYDERAVRAVQMLIRLRRTGMPIAQMREYIALIERGEATRAQRLGMLREHRAAVLRQMEQLRDDLSVLDHKISDYQQSASDLAST